MDKLSCKGASNRNHLIEILNDIALEIWAKSSKEREGCLSLSAIPVSIRAPISRLFPNLVGRNGSFHKSLA